MGRDKRTGGFRSLIPGNFFFSSKSASRRRSGPRARRFVSATSHFRGLEALEARVMLSSTPTLLDGVLTCAGYTGQSNIISVSLSSDGSSIDASVDGSSASFAVGSVQAVVIDAGTRTDSIKLGAGVNCQVTLVEGSGIPGTSDSSGSSSTGSGSSSSGAGSSSTGTGSTSTGAGSSSTGAGSTSTGTGSSSTGGGSSSTGSGSSSTGSGSGSKSEGSNPGGTSLPGGSSSGTGSGASSTGAGSSSTGSGSSSTGSGSSSTGVGSTSTGTGSSSTGTGSSSTGSGSSSTGTGSSSTSTGSSSTGSGSSSTGSGSTSTGAGASSGGDTTVYPTDPNNPSTPGAVITLTSPDDTIYPEETVNVASAGSTLGDGNPLTDTFAWDFGDSSSAYNTVDGFSAAHAYTTPGTYTITLVISTPDGFVGKATKTVTIAPDNRTTIYVSPDGNDNNSGLSPSDPIQSIDQLNTMISSNERILFQAGGTYDMANGGILVKGLSHVYIGSYGSGAQPIIMYTGPQEQISMVAFNQSSQSIVVQGLTFDSIYTDNNDGPAIPTAVAPMGSGISILDNTFFNLTNDVNMNEVPSNVLVQGNSSPDPTALNAYFCWTQGYNIAIIGNTVANSVGESIIRVGGATDNYNILIADNDLANIADQDGDSKDIAKACVTVQGGYDIYVYNNTFSTGPAGEGPLGTLTGANDSATVSYTVFDSNLLSNGSTFVITPGVDETMFKNNVVIGNGVNYAFGVNSTENNADFNLVVQNLFIEHNTVDELGSNGGFIYVFDGESENITLDYNLFYGPNTQIGAGTAYVYDTNNDLNSFNEIKDNVWDTPGGIDSWVQGGMFYIGSNATLQTDWYTPAEWSATGVPTGDVYQTVVLGSTYSVAESGFTAGSTLPNS